MWKLVLELRRRRIFRTAGFYIVGAWVFLQVSDLVFPALDISESAIRFVWLGVILVSPLALIFAWFYDVGSNGILRTPPADKAADTDLRLRRSDYLLLLALLAITVAIGYRISTEIGELKTAETAGYAPVELDDNSIVVLPLRNISEDDTQLYFVDGMHEALIADLSRIRALKVISRTSSLQYRDTEKSLSEIGRELGAAKVVEGSVYRVGDEVRITIQLIDTRSDKLNWSGSYERELVDILELQREVGGAIAAEIEVLLTTEEQAFLASPRQVDPEAYENYLKGRFHWYEFTPKDLELASQYFQAALDIDPGYALAYVGYADARHRID
jgi:TolB-like protein